MTDAAPTRAAAPFALIFGILGFIIAAGLSGLYIWDRQQKDQEHTAMIIDQLRRIDDRLTKLENGQAQQDTTALNEKLDQVSLKIAEMSASDTSSISQQLQIIIEHQIKLQNDLADIKHIRAEMQQEKQVQATQQQQQAALLRELQAIAPTLLNPPTGNDFWSKLTRSWQRWVTVKPQASAAADTTTTGGKISRALYELEQGQVEAALNILPDDPRLSAFRANAEAYLAQSQAATAETGEAQTEAQTEEKPALHLPTLPEVPAEGETP
ncbi:MAG TPA: hypothetical protein PKW15_05025 [Alphaproteobacteria bacterium]|nr:hypothetical protein [Rhodospirillaceae bacterium]HRJ12587.1 hypothetical protein [Alphaproteobacteria bacterium]